MIIPVKLKVGFLGAYLFDEYNGGTPGQLKLKF